MSSARPLRDMTLRAITDDGAFRVIVARTTQTIKEICRLQRADSITTRVLGDLITGTVLFRETMAPDLRVQGILKAAEGKATLVADSAPEGKTRGLVQGIGEGGFELRSGALLQMMRTLQNGSVNKGLVRVNAEGSMTAALMTYMQESEQVDSMLAVGTIVEQAQVVVAGGYMVQLLPEVGKGPLAIMAQRLEDFRTIEHLLTPEFSPEELLEELLYRMPYTRLDTSPLGFSCWCSESRLLGALATLDRKEIRAMVNDGQVLEIDCDYCTKEYRIQPSALLGLLESS